MCEKDSVEYWWSKFPNPKKILKFNVTGILQKTDQKHLLNDSVAHNIIRARAFEYWTGSDGLNPIEEELLFEGIIKIVDEYTDLQSFFSKN